MIYRPGEIVKVISSSVAQHHFLGMLGKVRKISLEAEFPFGVEFKNSSKLFLEYFTHKELKLVDSADELLELYYYHLNYK